MAALVFAAMVAGGLFFRALRLAGRLGTEQARHETTRRERDAAAGEGLRWKALAEDRDRRIKALREAADQCLDRERAFREDAAAREAILREAAPVARQPGQTAPKAGVTTGGGKSHARIVDDATREKAADRLNRPL